MKNQNYTKGAIGETVAKKYLSNLGYSILENNWRTRYGEIDIIASRGDTLHFVEVKLKVGDMYGSPEEMINKKKILQILKTAQAYLLKNNKLNKQFKKKQIDAVCIVLNHKNELERLDYYENINC
ncbi:YraN family protein [Candidatus Microgenomates bacterium]|nr:MAG: YraN family protein [Candidatus Microgenomates bacterium]